MRRTWFSRRLHPHSLLPRLDYVQNAIKITVANKEDKGVLLRQEILVFEIQYMIELKEVRRFFPADFPVNIDAVPKGNCCPTDLLAECISADECLLFNEGAHSVKYTAERLATKLRF